MKTERHTGLRWLASSWAYLSWSVGAAAGGPTWIEVDPGNTAALRERGTGKPFVAVGVNYFSPHVGWAPKLWQRYDEREVREHLTLIREQGYNTIRVFLTLASFHREPGKVREEGERKFRHMLTLCRELGLYVIPTGPDHWEGGVPWRAEADPFADEQVLAADERWWREFTGRFRDEPAILAWDLLNEPTVRWNTPAMRTRWNVWLKERYASVEKVAAAWGRPVADVGEFGAIEVPSSKPSARDPRLLDYQRCREWVGEQWTRRHAEAIRAADAKHLVTVGHIQWAGTIFLPGVAHYAGFDLKATARHLDFHTVHFYPLALPRPCDSPEGIARNATYLEALLHEFHVGKPVMIGEFAWYGGGELRVDGRLQLPHQTPEDQAAWCAALLAVSRGRVCGWLHWAFADTPTSRDLTRWSGLWTEDLRIKPWGTAFAAFARRITREPAPATLFSPALVAYPFDRSAMLTDPQAGASALADLSASRSASSQPR